MYRNIGVAINVFIERDGKILLGQRIGKKHGWSPPGGHVEEGEHLDDAAKREALEETGLIVRDLKFLSVINDPSEDGTHYIHINFTSEGVEGEPKVMEPDKFAKWDWFSMDSLPEDIFIGSVKPILSYKEKVSCIA